MNDSGKQAFRSLGGLGQDGFQPLWGFMGHGANIAGLGTCDKTDDKEEKTYVA